MVLSTSRAQKAQRIGLQIGYENWWQTALLLGRAPAAEIIDGHMTLTRYAVQLHLTFSRQRMFGFSFAYFSAS